MNVVPSSKQAVLGISGHAGAGHVHSHSGFIQDDSAGFAAVASLIKIAYPVDTTIKSVIIKNDEVEVLTMDGGIGRAIARRGFTPHEAEIVQRAIGLNGLYSQSLAFYSMGRIYGQGVLEAPVALQTATCLAVIDTFKRTYPENIIVSGEGLEDNVGACMGTTLEIEGVCVSALAVLNATGGGLGPVEDLEGNLYFGDKGLLMKKLGLDNLPTIVLESKAYVPSICRQLETDTFWVRFNKEMDNPQIGKSLIAAIEKLNLPLMHSDQAYPRYSGEMKKHTESLSDRIVKLGQNLEKAKSASEKSKIIGKLAIIVSQDAGGITYMTEQVHEIAAGGGLVPGMTAVLSMAVSQPNIDRCKIPEFTAGNCFQYIKILVEAVILLQSSIDAANSYMGRKKVFDKNVLEQLIL